MADGQGSASASLPTLPPPEPPPPPPPPPPPSPAPPSPPPSWSPRAALLLRVAAAAALLVLALEGDLEAAVAAAPALAAGSHLLAAHGAAADPVAAAMAAGAAANSSSSTGAAATAAAAARTDIALPSASHSKAAASIDWGFVDKVIYINAAGAPMRDAAMRRDFLPALGKAPEDVIRLEAFPAGEGRPKVHGSGASHLAALQLAASGGFRNVLVLEDDMLWRVSKGRANLLQLEELAGLASYDVILLGGTYVISDPGSHRVEHSYSTSGYLVAGHYLQTLIDNFAFSLAGLETEPHRTKDFSIDVYWNVAMRRDAWFVIEPALAIQDHYATLYEPWTNGEALPFVDEDVRRQ